MRAGEHSEEAPGDLHGGGLLGRLHVHPQHEACAGREGQQCPAVELVVERARGEHEHGDERLFPDVRGERAGAEADGEVNALVAVDETHFHAHGARGLEDGGGAALEHVCRARVNRHGRFSSGVRANEAAEQHVGAECIRRGQRKVLRGVDAIDRSQVLHLVREHREHHRGHVAGHDGGRLSAQRGSDGRANKACAHQASILNDVGLVLQGADESAGAVPQRGLPRARSRHGVVQCDPVFACERGGQPQLRGRAASAHHASGSGTGGGGVASGSHIQNADSRENSHGAVQRGRRHGCGGRQR
mmetsp:Transcript_11216/g.43265  ORF Transcript_11216/g.43265 Transcript_11216/m.43265 type:complete len:302 (+) Transcript_11216:5407-6312(+)